MEKEEKGKERVKITNTGNDQKGKKKVVSSASPPFMLRVCGKSVDAAVKREGGQGEKGKEKKEGGGESSCHIKCLAYQAYPTEERGQEPRVVVNLARLRRALK